MREVGGLETLPRATSTGCWAVPLPPLRGRNRLGQHYLNRPVTIDRFVAYVVSGVGPTPR
jgi:hypothetical protein